MNPSLGPGARLTCIRPDRHFLVEGQTYTVREVIGVGRETLVDVSKNGGWPLFWPGRFKLAEDGGSI